MHKFPKCHRLLDDLYKTNPGLIYTRISGYGQTGPYSKRPGFASVCEGMGGFRYVNGIPGMPPVRPNLSLGDSLAGLHAAFGVVLGLLSRNKLQNRGQVVDVAIYESVLNMMESVVPEYDRKQVVIQWNFYWDHINCFMITKYSICLFADSTTIRIDSHRCCPNQHISLPWRRLGDYRRKRR